MAISRSRILTMSKLNSEFNYRYQVIGETPWAKIQTLQGFLCGRKRAAALEQVQELKHQARISEIEWLKSQPDSLRHVILNLQADILECESSQEEAAKCFRDNEDEIIILEKLLEELYAIVEPTRIAGYSDEQMFELNAANEFTVMIGKEIQAEIIANGRPSAAKIRNAMSNPYTLKALQNAGFIPDNAVLLTGNANPLQIELMVDACLLK